MRHSPSEQFKYRVTRTARSHLFVIRALVSVDFTFASSIPVTAVKALPLPVGNTHGGVPKCSGGWDTMELIVLMRLPITFLRC